MKRIIKRILPILLCLIVLASIAWYLFSYDRAFTQDMLLSGARYFEKQGNHSFATWLYNQAYYQCGGNVDVILELADQFKSHGNYTKAEVTLSKAIAEGASIELYLALCQTYVEQDKLLDASNFLDNIVDPEIKSQLEALRPSAPIPSPAPGFYSQYVTVSFEKAPSSQLYVSRDGEFPSSKTDLYTENFQLSSGENVIYAISVGENGLVSEPVYYGYTIGGVIEEVSISDPVMDALLREQLDISSERQLMSNDLWDISELTIPSDVSDLSDLVRLPYLQSLTIENSTASSFQPLSSLAQLKNLNIRGCVLSSIDLTVISALPNLEHLTLSDCSLSNIEPLSNSPHLVSLDLSQNAIRDVTPLSFMENLTKLDLSNNALTNISPLSALTSLQELNVSYNSLSSIAPLSTCTSLTNLNAAANQIDQLIAFPDSNLQQLDLSNNLLIDINVLAEMTALTNLDISQNLLTDISALSALSQLEVFRFSRNEIAELPSWNATCALTAIDGSYNKLTSVAVLKGLSRLNRVNFDYNSISNVTPLADCRNLIQVDIFGNPVSDVSKLKDMDVIVNYDPT